MKYNLLLLFCLMSLMTFGQSDLDSSNVILLGSTDPWFSFLAEDGFTRGFKNSKEDVMIPPRFQGFTHAETFRNIIAVMEGKQAYYLLKNGQKVGFDSLFVTNMSYDCESEGMIRFVNPITGLIGYFNSDGKIAIPAIYSDASSFKNGVAVVLEGGQKICLDNSIFNKHQPCEVWEWKGGTQYLINKKNKKLISNFPLAPSLDFYSMVINNPILSKYQIELMGQDGNKYRFNDIKKEFEVSIENLNKKIEFYNTTALGAYGFALYLKDIMMPDVAVSRNGNTKIISSEPFIHNNWKIIMDHLQSLKDENVHSFVTIGELDRQLWGADDYKKYFDDCGQASTKYPILRLVITYRDKENQVFLDFLKIDKDPLGGSVFQLIGVHAEDLIID